MFKKTKSLELTLFESPSNLMRGRALKKYDDPEAWHNQFYELVTSNIDEDKFKPLFKSGNMGRGNASISQLVAIMIMKEGNRRSDEQMFEAVYRMLDEEDHPPYHSAQYWDAYHPAYRVLHRSFQKLIYYDEAQEKEWRERIIKDILERSNAGHKK